MKRTRRNNLRPQVGKSNNKLDNTGRRLGKTHDGWYDMGDGWKCPTLHRSANCKFIGHDSIDENGITGIKGRNEKENQIPRIDPSLRNYENGFPIWDEDGSVMHPGWWTFRPSRMRGTVECFVAGTKVIMKNGPDKNIEDIDVGEEVISYNVHTKQLEPKIVSEIFTQTHDLKDGDITVKITFENGQVLHNTIANPFWSKDKGFVAVDEERCNRVHAWVKETNSGSDINSLEINDILFKYNEDSGEIEEIKVTDIEYIMEEGIRTYDIHVEDNHTFFVDGILTHNSSGLPGPPPPPPPPPPGGVSYNCSNGNCYQVGGNSGTYSTLGQCQNNCHQSGTWACYGAVYCYHCDQSLEGGLEGYPYVPSCTMANGDSAGQPGTCGSINMNYDPYWLYENGWGGGYHICDLFRTRENCEAGKLLDPNANMNAPDNHPFSSWDNYQATNILNHSPFGQNSGDRYGMTISLGGHRQAGERPHTPSWWFDFDSWGTPSSPLYEWNYGQTNWGSTINQHHDIWHDTLEGGYGCVWAFWPNN
tara:strand:- start:759 stop:2357 length:1599 start_codon:yes stop_codon:yes gene_type:complete